MRSLTAAIVIGQLVLIGALPAAAGQSGLARGAGAPAQLAADDDATGDKDTYAQKAREEMQEWQRKLHDVGAQAQAKGQEAGNAAGDDLNVAWTKAKAASGKLQAAGAEDWESAKASYERASNDLARAWHRIHPDDK
jgi:hypothetical protein